ncbi:hypothetical protein LENED_001012 [Lentinula edodes]|uniref:Uncharacterized protein n=1 Tax=Lentinula edodes TaxID=5353 RepID=A0A1Q3DX85_LENED|nr:hypothetical protein LENED_001012 [Lentinula edodes]
MSLMAEAWALSWAYRNIEGPTLVARLYRVILCIEGHRERLYSSLPTPPTVYTPVFLSKIIKCIVRIAVPN